MWQSKPYRTAVALQSLIEQAAPIAEDKDLASLTKSFVALEMLKLRLRMKPAPKPVDVASFEKPKRKPKAFTEAASEAGSQSAGPTSPARENARVERKAEADSQS